jgi:phage terminase large subunit
MFIRTTAINKILAMKARKKIIQGGTWAGKTYGIIPCMINTATQSPNKVGTIVAETIPALKGGAIKDFKNIMYATKRWHEDRWNASELHYTFGNKYKLEFKSFDSVGKAQAAGKRDHLFINEAPYIAYDIADALIGRTTEDVFIDFNPTSEFWGHTEILPNKDAEFLLLKYSDNEALPKTIYEELMMKLEKAYHNPTLGNIPNNIKNDYWANWCRVYIDGEIGSLQGVVFEAWQQIDEVPKDVEFVSYGLDWGYTKDPTALIAVYRNNKNIYVDELLYQQKLTNSMIVDKLAFLNVQRHHTIVADSAEPKSIADLQNAGYYVEAAMKGKDSINNSIARLQEFNIYITQRSTNLIKELRNYSWSKTKDGTQTNTPIDNYNHAIDALRYVALNKLQVYQRTNEIHFAEDY